MARRIAAAGAADQELSPRRAARLYRLVQELSRGAQARAKLIRMGKAGMRTFYRDLSFLEGCGISVKTTQGHYELSVSVDESLARLPFPNPNLTFGDIIELSKGSGGGSKKLAEQLSKMV